MNKVQIQSWLRRVGQENAAKLGMAMLGSDPVVRNLIYQNMSERARSVLQADIERYQKMVISEQTIAGCASELEKLIPS